MIARAGQPLVAITAVLALAGAIALQVVRDRVYPRDEAMRANLLYVRSGEAVKRLALEYQAISADVYWIRAIQHFGGARGQAHRGLNPPYELLYPMLDLTTTLDPYFKMAYRFGAIFLAEPRPGGPGRPDLAVALLRKAVAAQPGKWQYYHDIAFVYYWNLRDYAAAAEWFNRAASQPEAPNWLTPVAASMLTQGNDRTSARFLWRQLLNADQPWIRASAERSLLQIDAMDVMDQLEQRIRDNPPPAGERYSWAWLVRRGVLRGIPLDTARQTPYEIDPGTGRVTISPQSPLFPMPDSTRNPKP